MKIVVAFRTFVCYCYLAPLRVQLPVGVDLTAGDLPSRDNLAF